MKNNVNFHLYKINYIILICSICIIVLGYVIMGWGIKPNMYKFNQEIYSFRNITLAPIILFIGYSSVFISIFIKRKSEVEKEKNS